MTIRSVRRLLYLGILLAGGVGLLAWGLVYGVAVEGVGGSELAFSGDGATGEDPHPRPLSQGERGDRAEERGGRQAGVLDLVRFEGRRLQRPVIDVPVAPVVVTAPVVPMVQLPSGLQLTGVLVGSVPGTGTAFLRVGQSPAEVVRVGEAMQALPEVMVLAITREMVTVRYQGQAFTMTLATASPVLRRAE